MAEVPSLVDPFAIVSRGKSSPEPERRPPDQVFGSERAEQGRVSLPHPRKQSPGKAQTAIARWVRGSLGSGSPARANVDGTKRRAASGESRVAASHQASSEPGNVSGCQNTAARVRPAVSNRSTAHTTNVVRVSW